MTRRTCQKRAFTLLELLVVIGIIALLATIGIGALKGFNAVNVVQAGNRQLLDDINRARNTAQNERTTVYMVFVPPLYTLSPFLTTSLTNIQQKQAITNRFSGQYTSYNFVELRTPGDQPGRGKARYLSDWKSLPAGVYITTNEFMLYPAASWLSQASVTNATIPTKPDMPFVYIPLPFPTANSPKVPMPCIAFNFRGGLVGPDEEKPRNVDEILSLTRGSIILPRDSKEQPKFGPNDTVELIETPRGNSTNNPFIRIDWITGRPRLEGA